MQAKLVSDLMLPLEEYATVHVDATVKDALSELTKKQLGLTDSRHNHRAVLVLDDTRQVVGKLSHWGLLRALEPKLLQSKKLENLTHSRVPSFMVEALRDSRVYYEGELASLVANAGKMRVGDAMVPILQSIEVDALLSEAIHSMVLGHMQSLVVTKDCHAIGILRLSDVFEAIADAIRRS